MTRSKAPQASIEGRVTVAYTSIQGDKATKDYHPSITLETVEREWVSKSLIHHGGNMVAAAKSLGISRATLYRKMQSMAPEVS